MHVRRSGKTLEILASFSHINRTDIHPIQVHYLNPNPFVCLLEQNVPTSVILMRIPMFMQNGRHSPYRTNDLVCIIKMLIE